MGISKTVHEPVDEKCVRGGGLGRRPIPDRSRRESGFDENTVQKALIEEHKLQQEYKSGAEHLKGG